jgi:hypothetical protein
MSAHMEDFSFQLAVTLSADHPLPIEAESFLVGEENGRPVYLRSGKPGRSIAERSSLVLHGSGYPSEEFARQAGLKWRGVVARVFAYARVGADFRNRADGNPPLAVYRTGEGQIVFAGHARGTAPVSLAELRAAFDARGAHVPLRESERLASELFGLSFFVDGTPQARFMMLMMAVEALMEQNYRSEEAQAWISQFVATIKAAADLHPDEKQALIQALQLQKRESLSQAGRRLAAALTGRRYGDHEAPAFFTACYTLRGRLAHSQGEAVPQQEVQAAIRPLQDFVGDLLAGPALLVEVSQGPAASGTSP